MWYVGILQPCKTTRKRYLKAKEEDVFQPDTKPIYIYQYYLYAKRY